MPTQTVTFSAVPPLNVGYSESRISRIIASRETSVLAKGGGTLTKHPQLPREEWLARRARILGCAASLIHDAEHRIMLLHTSWTDEWQLPGGGHDEGEDLWQTAVRETYEETGLAMPDEPELLAVDWGLHPEGIPEIFTLFKGPLVDASTIEVTLSDEHDAWRMLTAEEWVPLVHPEQARVLTIANDVLHGGRCPYLREASHLADTRKRTR